MIFFVLAFAVILAICGTASAAAVHNNNTTISHSNNSQVQTLKLTSTNAKKTSPKGDPIITGTVTINRYGTGTYYALKGATITVNSTSGRVLGTTTTDQNGNYYINFYSTDTSFLVTCSFLGCNSTMNTVPVTLNNTDKLYYGSSNFQLRPNSAKLTSLGSGTNVKIKNGSTSDFAGVINVDINGVNYTAYCIDLYTNIAIGNSLFVNGPLPGTIGDLNGQIDWGKVNYIIKNYSPTTDTEAAAMQCAIWYFTSVQYGAYPGNDSSHTDRYQYMTNSTDGITSGRSSNVRNRALQMINAATSVQYPTNIDIQPGNIRVENGKTTTLTATVTDKNGNPLSGINVNFYTNKGTLSIISGVTNSLGQISTILSGISSNSATVYAMVNGTYGTLLYDNPANPLQNLVAVNAIPYTFYDSSTVNFDVRSDVQLSQTSTTPLNVGDTYKYVVKAHNNGSNVATGILISDVIPAGLTNYTVTPSVGTFINGIWTIPTLAVNGDATLTITGIVTSSMAGLTYTNVANITGQDQYNSYLYTTSAADVYIKKSVLNITNTATNNNVNVGDTGKFTITIYNSGPDAANNIQLTDILPSGYSASWTSGNYANNIWTINSLASGSYATLTFTGTITPSMAGKTTTNHATVTWNEYPKTVTISDSTIYVKDAEVALSQTTSGTNVNVGDTVTYTVIANNGPDTATNIIITDNIPTGLTNLIITPSIGTYSNGIWTIPTLTNGEFATLTITGKAGPSMAGKNTTNTATRTSQTEYNSQPTTTTATVYTKIADPVLTQTVNEQNTGKVVINVGDNLTFVVTATTDQDVHNVVIEDKIPDGLKNVSVIPSVGSYDINTGLWTIPFLSQGSSATLTINGQSASSMAGLSITNTANETSQEEYNPNPGYSESIPVYTKLADLWLIQTVNQPKIGNNAIYTITVINYGPDTATNINLYNILPTGLQNLVITPSIRSFNQNTGIWTIDTLGNSETATLTITGKVPSSGIYTNTIKEIGQTEYNQNLQMNKQKSELVVSAVDIRVKQYPWYYNADTQTYQYLYQCANTPVFTVDVRNSGPDDATNVVITYTIGSGLQYNGYSAYIGTVSVVDNTLTWTIPYMPNGGKAILKVYTTILGTGNQTPSLTNTATLTSLDQQDTNSANNQASCALIVPTTADIGVTQNYSTEINDESEYVYININVANNGPNDATNVIINDLLPNGLTFVSADTGGIGTYNPTTGIWNIGTLTNGTEATLTIKAIITQAVYNTVSTDRTSAAEYDWNANNNSQRSAILTSPAPS